MGEFPSEARRTFLEVHLGPTGGLRLLQLEPYTKFANVFRMLGPGALYWGNRQLAANDIPARLRMPVGVDRPVDLYFEPTSLGTPRAGTRAGQGVISAADGSEACIDADDDGGDSSHFDPRRQPIPPVLPAAFEPVDTPAGPTGGGSSPPRAGQLLSPSIPAPHRTAATPPRLLSAAVMRLVHSQPRGSPVGLADHRYAGPSPLRAASATAVSSGGGHPYAVSAAAPSRGRLGTHARPQPPPRRANASVLLPPADVLVDGGPDGRPPSLEEQVRSLRQELQEMRRERAGGPPPPPTRHPAGDLVSTPRGSSTAAAQPAPPAPTDVEALAGEIHFQQMRRLLELRALHAQARSATLA